MRRRSPLLIVLGCFAFAGSIPAAELPAHAPLRILIVSDEVNPHGLSAAELTQPGDLQAAISSLGSGISTDAVTEIATDDLAQATTALLEPVGSALRYDVLIYFAHRIPNGAAGATFQEEFASAMESFLVSGGGVIAFHHGLYESAGKESVLSLLGASASGAVPWDTIEGQNLIDVSGGHFVTSHAVEAIGSRNYGDAAHGIAAADYPYFNNTPDERYPNLDFRPDAEAVELLLASDYDQGGSTHVLAYTHRRAAWGGIVVGYQPGEYQPNALDDPDGNNFQILANAILYASRQGVVASPAAGRGEPRILAVWPNPFHSRSFIEFTLPVGGRARLSVFDVAGHRVFVRELEGPADSPLRFAWDGLSDSGARLGAGSYFLRLQSAQGSVTRKLSLRR